jgi:hypothetical protein
VKRGTAKIQGGCDYIEDHRNIHPCGPWFGITAGVDRFAGSDMASCGQGEPSGSTRPPRGRYSRRDRGRGSYVKVTLARRYTGCF